MEKTVSLNHDRLEAGLYLVSTPIGNLRDITLRALETLHSCDLIACEDTRTSGKLLQSYAIKTKAVAYHDHSSDKVRDRLLSEIADGKAIALISDAGTPLISDPGHKLVKQAIESKVKVIPVPGANAPLPALQLSGLPSDKFLFGGFLPSKQGELKRRLDTYSDYPETLIFYESARRLNTTLDVAREVMGDRNAAVIREITKLHEETIRGTFSDLLDTEITLKGEFVLAIAGADQANLNDESLMDLLREELQTQSFKSAVASVAAKTGVSKTHIYNMGLKVRDEL